MKKLIFGLVVFLFSQLVAANAPNGLPSFGEAILKEQFPEYQESKTNVERGLRRYRVQLETFREEVLEGFNRAVLEYRRKLVESDQKLELDRKKGRITKEQYAVRHQYIKSELGKSKGSGEYMKAYFLYLGKYKAESKWVVQELAVEEKKKFKF